MKFALKICLYTILIVTILFAVAGQILVAQSFDAALKFRVRMAEAEFSALGSALEAEIYGIRLYYNEVSREMYEEILNRASRNQNIDAPCAIYDTGQNLVVSTGGAFPDTLDFKTARSGRFSYKLERADSGVILKTAGGASIGGNQCFLAVDYPADDLMSFRKDQIRSVTVLHLITVTVCTLVMLTVSIFVSRPLVRLRRFAAVIGEGNYTRRAKVTTLDEIGDLTVAFNEMTGSIEHTVDALENNAKQQRDFVASFSHEIKTPMTSIIGYADMLRRQELDKEDAFMAANFIYSEGKRLEALSLKLMDLVVLDQQDYQLSRGYSRKALGHVVAVVTPMLENAQLEFIFEIDQQIIYYERDLLPMLVTNLIDNARKASSPGKRVWLTGKRASGRYRITVRDEGIGIPKEELSRITEAFYMVDKSRAREMHGAGLGLAIANRIATVHGSSLHFDSETGKGTTVWFDVPVASKEQGREQA